MCWLYCCVGDCRSACVYLTYDEAIESQSKTAVPTIIIRYYVMRLNYQNKFVINKLSVWTEPKQFR